MRAFTVFQTCYVFPGGMSGVVNLAPIVSVGNEEKLNLEKLDVFCGKSNNFFNKIERC